MTPPCKRCPDRSPTCHGKCEKYAEFVAWNEDRKRAEYLSNMHPDGRKKHTEQELRKKANTGRA